jgi:hypothetical protein
MRCFDGITSELVAAGPHAIAAVEECALSPGMSSSHQVLACP